MTPNDELGFGDPILRAKLEAMAEELDITRHPALLAVISRSHPNSISVLQSLNPLDRYTCLMHVLDFTERPAYLEIANYGLRRVFAGASFAQWLVDHKCMPEILPSCAGYDDVLFYFAGKKFKHAGLHRCGNRVVSKWGTGHLYEHAMFEVPESYGNEVRAFKRPTYDKAMDDFIKFSEENGIPFQPQE